MNLKSKIRTVPNWPIKGVMFRDITTILQDADAFKFVIDEFYERYKDKNIDKIVGIDSRGFIFGSVLAYKLNVGFVPVRKKGKLPYKTIQAEFEKEYGKDVVEMHIDAIKKGENVVIIDDLIATGGTILAAIELVEKLGGNILESAFVVSLPDLKGMEKLGNHKIFTMIDFEGE